MATQTKTTTKTIDKPLWRRSASAYIGLYGIAYDRAQLRSTQARELTENLFEFLSEKGETTFKQAELLAKQAQKGAWTNYSATADKVAEILPAPFKAKSKVTRMEDEVVELRAQLERMANAVTPTAPKTAKKKAIKKPVAKKAVVKTETKIAKPVVKAVAAKVEAVKVETPVVKAEVKTAKVKTVETNVETPAVKTEAKPVADTPRHIPYFVEVKRYDPLANEDVVRKIVNHCGIALSSEDGRSVACSDASERATVRDSWLKKKLGLEGSDADLDKKVLEVCTLMQRDQKKARVTFYYLLAKKERMLETL